VPCCVVPGIMVQVEPKSEDCLFQVVEAGAKVKTSVLISRGGKLDIKYKVRYGFVTRRCGLAVSALNTVGRWRVRTTSCCTNVCYSRTSTMQLGKSCPPFSKRYALTVEHCIAKCFLSTAQRRNTLPVLPFFLAVSILTL